VPRALPPRPNERPGARALTPERCRDRRQQAQLAEALRALLASRPGRSARLSELLKAVKEQTLLEVTMQEMRDAAGVLVADGSGALVGDSLSLR
jgi:hypothetical protein